MPSIIGQGAIEATFFWQVVLGFCRGFLKVSLHLPSLRPFPSHHLVFLIFTFLSLFFPVSTSTIFLVTTFPNLNPFYSPRFFSVSTFPQCPLFMCLVLPFLTLTLPGPSAGLSGSLDSYCSLKPLCSGMGEVVPARTSPTLLLPSPRTVLSLSCFKVLPCINCRDWHCKS